MENLIQHSKTADGSWTCFNTEVGEHYHNRSGAYTETVNIYTNPTNMEERLQKSDHIVVYDPFFGLGYNSLACMHRFSQLKQSRFPEARLTIIAVDLDPEILAHSPEIIEAYNEDDLKRFLPAFEHKIYYQTHSDPPLPDLEIGLEAPSQEGISIKLIVGDARQVTQALPENAFDVVYQDPFSPRKHPQLWTTQLFQQYFRILKPDYGAVFTYSAAAPIRSSFHNAGFAISPLIVSDQKSGTVAYKNKAMCSLELSELEQQLMACKSGLPYEDNERMTLSMSDIIEQREKRVEESDRPSSSSVHRTYGHHKKYQRLVELPIGESRFSVNTVF